MLGFYEQRHCDYCHREFKPTYPGQRFCRRWCRLQGKKAEAKAARRTWGEAGRPMIDQDFEVSERQ